MDPLTLFALANGAVQAVKKGCELYKEIAGVAGDVKNVLNDLDSQFESLHKDKPPTVAERNQYVEEKQSHEVYTGEASIGKRALQRVLMQSRLTAMEAELRELMVYNCPPELGDLYTRVFAMMEKMKKEQVIAWAKKIKSDQIAALKKRRRIEHIKCNAWKYGITVLFILYILILIWSVVEIRKTEKPELGVCLLPKGTWFYEKYNNLKWVECDPITAKD